MLIFSIFNYDIGSDSQPNMLHCSHFYVSHSSMYLQWHCDRAAHNWVCDQLGIPMKNLNTLFFIETPVICLDTGIIPYCWYYNLHKIRIITKYSWNEKKTTCSSDSISCILILCSYKNSKNIFMKMILLSYTIPTRMEVCKFK